MRADDKDIVETLKACPENGFRMLMAKYQEAVYWHIRRLVVSHDDAQDASQETFVRIYRSLMAMHTIVSGTGRSRATSQSHKGNYHCFLQIEYCIHNSHFL
mgnify:CR=1 FL=1